MRNMQQVTFLKFTKHEYRSIRNRTDTEILFFAFATKAFALGEFSRVGPCRHKPAGYVLLVYFVCQLRAGKYECSFKVSVGGQ